MAIRNRRCLLLTLFSHVGGYKNTSSVVRGLPYGAKRPGVPYTGPNILWLPKEDAAFWNLFLGNHLRLLHWECWGNRVAG